MNSHAPMGMPATFESDARPNEPYSSARQFRGPINQTTIVSRNERRLRRGITLIAVCGFAKEANGDDHDADDEDQSDDGANDQQHARRLQSGRRLDDQHVGSS